LRWPGRIVPRRTTDVLHITDLYPTLAKLGGASLPIDRPIDGIDQLGFFLGERPTSARDGFPYYIKTELRAVKWRDWKMHLMWEVEPNEGPIKLETPYLFNLVQDPKEETDANMEGGWVRGPIRRLIESFQASLKAHPPIPPGAPDGFRPGAA
ncbi:MAG: arylsulfatase, partial [Alphaproteobacteria bacterium]|nr:arylsulfatase [Alphaproteobacteria bacterium]